MVMVSIVAYVGWGRVERDSSKLDNYRRQMNDSRQMNDRMGEEKMESRM